MKKNLLMKAISAGMISATALSYGVKAQAAPPSSDKLNVMLILADDLGYEEVGYLGSNRGLTPNVDKLSKEGMSFFSAHECVGICMPSRGVLGTGRFGHNSGMVGFINCKKDVPTIMEVMQENGYLTGVLGKVHHSTPKAGYKWDFVHDYRELGAGRSPEKYYNYCKEFLARCKKEGKPFYFMVNSHDPHRPWQDTTKFKKGSEKPSKWHKPEDVIVPPYLPDHPKVRQDLCNYYNSVRRFDDTVGRVLTALKESGLEKNTIVMLMSDNGIAVPFAKCNTYLVSTKTPWIVRWPGHIKPGTTDKKHFISGVDFYPTIMDATGIKKPEKLDGRSFMPLLQGKSQKDRDYVFTQIDHKIGSGKNVRFPMRCVQGHKYGYIFNAWSDGKKRYRNSNEKLTMEGMEEAAKTDPAVAERIKLYRYRVPEEFYDLEADPGCTKNLVKDPKYAKVVDEYRQRLRNWMVKFNDPLLPAFDVRDDIQAVQKVLNTTYPTIPKVNREKKNKKERGHNKRQKSGRRRKKTQDADLAEAA